MAIPASYIADVTPRVISSGAAGITINGLFLTKNRQMIAGSIKEFITSNAVAEYFGYDSEEYMAAMIYFAGYMNSFKKPAKVKFASRIGEALPAFLRGGKFTLTLSELKAITNGSLKITVNGTNVSASNIDLSTAVSLSSAAKIIETAITESASQTLASVTYSALNKAFRITSTTSGADSSISFASAADSTEGTDLSALLALTASSGAVISIGRDALTPFENMALIAAQDSDFGTFTTLYDADSDEAIGLGKWANSGGVNFCYIPWSNEAAALMPDNETDLSSVMRAAGVTNFAPVYNDSAMAAGLMGIFAAVDWNRLNGAIDASFKRVQGLTPTVFNEQDASALDKKFYTYMGRFATKNTLFDFIYKGSIVGDYVNLSTYINAIWFNETIKNALMSGLQGIGKVPYNESGYGFIRAWISDPINQALNNGVIQTGVALSEAQKAAITSEVGTDISPELYANGYFLNIVDPGASARTEGESPVISLYYTDGGVVKKLQVASTAIL